jgi:hypothetical protein
VPSNGKRVCQRLVLHVHKSRIFFWVHISIASDQCLVIEIRARRLCASFLRLKLNRFSLGQTSLQSECLGRHFLRFSIATLHFKLVGLLEKVIDCLLQLFEVIHTPFPRVAVLSEVFPFHQLRPFSEQTFVIALNVGDLTNNSLIVLKLLHYFNKVVVGDSVFLRVERLE